MTRTSAVEWEVTSDGASADALCEGDGSLVSMPVHFVITTTDALPVP